MPKNGDFSLMNRNSVWKLFSYVMGT